MMKKIEDRDRKIFYFRCEGCGKETEEVKMSRDNMDAVAPHCPRCGK